ncbi:MAG: sugar kinase [Kangiellaceae bacterium]|nr:sugar kinase [Kangiellaceae bacterium]
MPQLNRLSEMNVAIIGECMIEISGQPFGTLNQNYGGDSMNTAIYLKKMAKDISISFVSSMGTDSLSQAMINKWQANGVDTQFVLVNENKHAGLYMIENDENGERTFHYWRNDSAAKYMVQHSGFNKVINRLREFNAVYLSGISLAILPSQDQLELLNQLQQLSSHGVKIIFDSNYRPSLWTSETECKDTMQKVFSICDLALVTLEDENLLWNDATVAHCQQRLHDLGVKELVVKDGENGAYHSQEGVVTYQSTEKISSVVDTTSAGDSFNAGFLSQWLQGNKPKQCLKVGNALAGQVIQKKGAIVDFDLESLNHRLSQ